MAEKAGDVYVQIGARFDKMDAALAKMEKKTSKSAKKMDSGMSSAMKNIGGAIAGAFAVSQLIDFQKQIISVTSEFQKLNAVLVNTLGDTNAADMALAQIVEFAKETPFAVSELTSSFVKLVNQGFKPTMEQMRLLGDVASSTGKTFDQLTEAIIDAQTGEFERLKEFGIRASKMGDQVTFTFKGVETQVGFTNDAIRDYILSLGELEGVSGASAAISKTLGGKLNNLGDAWEQLILTIGSAESGFMVSIINRLSDGISNLNDQLQSAGTKGKKAATAIFNIINAEGRDTALILEDLTAKFINQRNELDRMKRMVSNKSTLFNQEDIERQTELVRQLGLYQSGLLTVKKATDDVNKNTANQIGLYGQLEDELKKLEESKVFANTAQELAAINAQLAITNQKMRDLHGMPFVDTVQEINRPENLSGINFADGVLDLPANPTENMTASVDGLNLSVEELIAKLTRLKAVQMQSFTPEQYQEWQAEIDKLTAKLATLTGQTIAQTQVMTGAVSQAYGTLSSNVMSFYDDAETSWGKTSNAIGKAALDIIAAALGQAIALATVNGEQSASATGPAAVVTAPAFIASAIGAVMGAFASIPAFATGGQARGGMSLVGERGPELVNLSKGSIVTPNHQMNSALTYGSSTAQMLPVRFESSIKGDDIFITSARGSVNINR